MSTCSTTPNECSNEIYPQAHICSYPGCTQKHHAQGFCKKHYRRLLKYGDPAIHSYQENTEKKIAQICTVDGCTEIQHAQGFCNNHYRRFLRHGYPSKEPRFIPNSVVCNGDVCKILIKNFNGDVKTEVIIDAQDLAKVKDYHWKISGYEHRVQGYKQGDSRRQLEFIHRVIMEPLPGMVVDHINHDILDNRKANLRICTHQQNQWNTRPSGRHNKQHGYKGVRLMKGRKCWRARIYLNGKQIHIGCFTTQIEAALAYNECAKKYYGEFACLNEIPEGGACHE
jgi:hypothetical protein